MIRKKQGRATAKKVLILGKNGQLGEALASELKDDFIITSVTRRQLDISKRDKVFSLIKKIRPDYVINAAAYNKVEEAEEDVEAAYAANAFGPYNLALASTSVGALLVHVSTDYVFGNEKKSYTEQDRPSPLNVYGASKLAGEQLVMIVASRHMIIRTSALFGGRPSGQKMNFVDKMIHLSKTYHEIDVVSDQFTSPTYVIDLSKKIKELILKKAPSGIYHVTNSGSCSWFQLAKKIFEVKGIPTKIKKVSTVQFATKIRRPRSALLMNNAIKKLHIQPLRPWQYALKSYLDK